MYVKAEGFVTLCVQRGNIQSYYTCDMVSMAESAKILMLYNDTHDLSYHIAKPS